MIVACAIAAGSDYLVTRDKDILSLDRYEGIRFVTPEALLNILRERKDGTGAPDIQEITETADELEVL